jgi:hypothetical protein
MTSPYAHWTFDGVSFDVLGNLGGLAVGSYSYDGAGAIGPCVRETPPQLFAASHDLDRHVNLLPRFGPWQMSLYHGSCHYMYFVAKSLNGQQLDAFVSLRLGASPLTFDHGACQWTMMHSASLCGCEDTLSMASHQHSGTPLYRWTTVTMWLSHGNSTKCAGPIEQDALHDCCWPLTAVGDCRLQHDAQAVVFTPEHSTQTLFPFSGVGRYHLWQQRRAPVGCRRIKQSSQ